MNTLTVTITSPEAMNTIEDFNLTGGALLASDARFNDVYYHHYLKDNNLVGEKTLIDSNTMQITRTGFDDIQKVELENMYKDAAAVYQDNGWSATWVFE